MDDKWALKLATLIIFMIGMLSVKSTAKSDIIFKAIMKEKKKKVENFDN